jgi:hypothetical protein
MALYTFGDQTGPIPLSQLDWNFAQVPNQSNVANTVLNAAQANITSVGRLTGLSVVGNVLVTGPISANSITSTAGNLTVAAPYGITATNMFIDNDGPNIGNAVITGNLEVRGNITFVGRDDISTGDLTIIVGNNLANTTQLNGAGIVAGLLPTGTLLYNTLTNSWQTNLTITPTSNIAGLNLGATTNYWNTLYAQSTMLSGTMRSGNVISNNYQATNITATGNVAVGGNLSVTGAVNLAGNIVSAGNITGVTVFADALSVTGTITVNGLTASGTLYSANITTGNITAANVASGNLLNSGNITSIGLSASGAVVAGSFSTANSVSAAGNILAGGSISVAGNITGANVVSPNFVGGTIIVTGNITGGNIATAGSVTATGNIATAAYLIGTFLGNIAGNITANGSNTQIQFNNSGNLGASSALTYNSATNVLTVTGNAVGGNLLTGGLISAVATITGGNLVTGGLITATGNIVGGNIDTAGQIVASGNIAGNNIRGESVSAGGNVTGYNINAVGVVSTGGNVIAANVNTAGQVIALGNVTGGNIATANTVSAGGNVTGSNFRALGLVSAAGNIAGSFFLGNGRQLTGIGNAQQIVNPGGWSVIPSGSKLYFSFNGANVGSLDSGGNFIVTGNVTAFGTP